MSDKGLSVSPAPGEKFARLTFKREAGFARGRRLGEFACECGGPVVALIYQVRTGNTKSCGCLSNDLRVAQGHANRKHGESAIGKRTGEYLTWKAMNNRCYNPKATGYKNYGGRGISVCAEWRHDYLAFLTYVGRQPTPAHTIDRYPDRNGNYEPGNVRWATPAQQTNNRRTKAKISAQGEAAHV